MDVTHPEAEWQTHLAAGRFMLPRSRSTGVYVFYPRTLVPGSGETDLEWVAASGKGSVYSTTVVRKKPPEPSYSVALIDLDEGPRMLATVVGIAPEDVRIGQRVQARVTQQGGAALIVFEPGLAGA